MTKTTKVEVTNSRQDGYRRGGIELKRGKNEIDSVDEKTLLALKGDPSLTVTVIGEAGNGGQTKELSDVVIIAMSLDDKTIYFNKDGSPRITKWQEDTGDKSLTKQNVIDVISAFEAEKKPTLIDVARIALSAEDKTIYFEEDGSPLLSKWQEDTGNETLTIEEITAALEAAAKTE